ncbi:hypothetical protein ONS96_010746 [Cadophora gregata f. sp. sojae]|nr:hypothetical protein ONS96_010746 [Cadophora gregata f. sp. sojae]
MADIDNKADLAKHVEAVDAIPSKVLVENAAVGSDLEHELAPWAAIKAYPMAVFWCLMVSMCVVMEGYDLILIGNFYAYPAFAKKYGEYVAETNNYQLTAPWQVALGNASGIGAFFGVLANGYLVDIFGKKKLLLCSLVVLSCFISMTFKADTKVILLLGEMLCGLPWGVFATTAPAYASEVLPLSLRVYMTSYTNMCFIMGQLIAAGVLSSLSTPNDQWAYRIPFALQWAWPVVLFPILLFAPESPWHLVRHGKLEEAEKSLARLVRKSANIDPKKTLAYIVHTNELEREIQAGTSYLDCFKGVELRRTEIACMAFAGQVFAGSLFAYNSTYFFQQIGLGTKATYRMNVGGTGMALAATLISWFAIMPYVGRRTNYLWGMGTMTVILFLIGFLNIKERDDNIVITQAALTLIWTFVFQLSAGQLGWALPAEVGSTRLRQKTICLARDAYYIINFAARTLEPYFLNPREWNLKGYTGFVWGGTALLTFIWAFIRLPETKDRTFGEIDILFANRVPARKFRKYNTDLYNESAPIVEEARS